MFVLVSVRNKRHPPPSHTNITMDTLDIFRRQVYLSFSLVLCVGYFTTEVVGELCEYRKSVYNIYKSQYDNTMATQECQWGCCNHHNSPCCSVPMSLIIGCILGGLAVFSVTIIAIFCILYCRRKATRARNTGQGSRRSRRRRSNAPNGHPGRDAIFFSNSSDSAVHVPDPFSEPPPSYEEVMQGLHGITNHGFKEDQQPV